MTLKWQFLFANYKYNPYYFIILYLFIDNEVGFIHILMSYPQFNLNVVKKHYLWTTLVKKIKKDKYTQKLRDKNTLYKY